MRGPEACVGGHVRSTWSLSPEELRRPGPPRAVAGSPPAGGCVPGVASLPPRLREVTRPPLCGQKWRRGEEGLVAGSGEGDLGARGRPLCLLNFSVGNRRCRPGLPFPGNSPTLNSGRGRPGGGGQCCPGFDLRSRSHAVLGASRAACSPVHTPLGDSGWKPTVPEKAGHGVPPRHLCPCRPVDVMPPKLVRWRRARVRGTAELHRQGAWSPATSGPVPCAGDTAPLPPAPRSAAGAARFAAGC